MVRLILIATGFVLTAWAVGLLLLAGYEASLIFTGDYDPATRGTAGILIGVVLFIAAALGLAGSALMRRGRDTRRPAQR